MKNLIVTGLSRCSFPRRDLLESIPVRDCLELWNDGLERTLVYGAIHERPHPPYLICAALPASAPVPWSQFDLSGVDGWEPPLDVESQRPVGLAALDYGVLVVSLRCGMLVEVVGEAGTVVGVVEDERSGCGGLLAMEWSPDKDLVVLRSPVKVIVMTREWENTGEENINKAKESQICWRADGESFVVSSLGFNGKMSVDVFNRDCLKTAAAEIDVVCKESSGVLSTAITWQPRAGGFISVGGPGPAVSFFEKNGLHHSRNDFVLSFGQENLCGPPRKLAWSSDSKKLAMITGDSDSVDIYTQSNYKWFKKLSLPIPSGARCIRWDEENCGRLYIASGNGVIWRYQVRHEYNTLLDTFATTFVIDGTRLSCTRFADGIVPPPLSHRVYTASDSILAVTQTSPSCAYYGCILANGSFEMFSWEDRGRMTWNFGREIGESDRITKRRELHLQFPPGHLRHPVLVHRSYLAIVESASADCGSGDSLVLYHLPESCRSASDVARYEADLKFSWMGPSRVSSGILFATTECGSVLRLRVDHSPNAAASLRVISLVERSSAAHSVIRMSDFKTEQGSNILVLLSSSGLLEVCDFEAESTYTISLSCTSFCLCGDFLLLTTRAHTLHSIPLEVDVWSKSSQNAESLASCFAGKGKTDSLLGAARPIDRGSLLITAIPGDVRVILQAPRGNLEAFAPRSVAIRQVRTLSRGGHFGKAFQLCRQQRIDMNVLVDTAMPKFIENISTFIAQMEKPADLSIFVTFLRGSEEHVNLICRTLLDAMLPKHKYILPIITTLLKLTPPDYTTALLHVHECFLDSPETANSALNYLLLLAKDDETLYRHALGTYNLSLAAMVARSSQMDPAEYSAELEALQHHDANRMKYTINVKLGRYALGLQNLFDCGEGDQEACLQFAIEHKLYSEALNLFRGDMEALKTLRTNFAQYLSSVDRHSEAAFMYILAGNKIQAALSYSKAGMWRQALRISTEADLKSSPSIACRDRVLEQVKHILMEEGNRVDAAHICARYQHDISGAIDILIDAEEWDEALSLVTEALTKKTTITDTNTDDHESLTGRVRDAMLESVEVMTADLRESSRKLKERSARLQEVRLAKSRLRESMTAGAGNEIGSDTFTETSLSTIDTGFTFGSSVATSYVSVRSLSDAKYRKAMARKQRKSARKRVKEGHPREEEYLMAYLGKLVPSDFLRARIAKLITSLASFGLLDQIQQLQLAMEDVLRKVEALPNDLKGDDVHRCLKDHTWKLACVR